MFDFRLSRNVLGVATLAAALTACGSDNPAGPGGSLDASEITAAQASMTSALNTQVFQSLLGGAELTGTLAPRTTLLDVNGAQPGVTAPAIQAALRNILSAGPLANAADPGTRESWYVDPALWGDTYVKNANGEFYVDPNRPGAPARGVRIALYERVGQNHNNTLVGWLDMIDSSTSTALIGRVNVLNAQEAPVGTFRNTMSETAASGGATTIHATFTGSLGVAPQTFVVADTMTGTRTDNGGNLRWHSVSKADFAKVAYSFLATGYDDVNDEAAEAELEITVGDHTTRFEGSSAMGGSGTANVYIDDQLVAKSTYDAETGDESVTGPNGGPVSEKVQNYLEAVTGVLAVLPNPIILHFIFEAMLWVI